MSQVEPTLLEREREIILFSFLFNSLGRVVRAESEGGSRELGVRASIDQDHHLARQEPCEAGQEHQLQEESLGRDETVLSDEEKTVLQGAQL